MKLYVCLLMVGLVISSDSICMESDQVINKIPSAAYFAIKTETLKEHKTTQLAFKVYFYDHNSQLLNTLDATALMKRGQKQAYEFLNAMLDPQKPIQPHRALIRPRDDRQYINFYDSYDNYVGGFFCDFSINELDTIKVVAKKYNIDTSSLMYIEHEQWQSKKICGIPVPLFMQEKKIIVHFINQTLQKD